jgi:hypothetical protein
MPLITEERQFLHAYVYEATHEPFGGPATRDLASRGISYSDIHWLLTAYHRTYDLENKWPMGRSDSNPPASPWADLKEAKERNQAMKEEWEPLITRGTLSEKERAGATR